jgi:manganese transport system substrate-binding protein
MARSIRKWGTWFGRKGWLFVLIVMLTASCATANQGKGEVLTAFTVLQDMAQNVAGSRLTVASITRPGVEIHGYEPTPQDIIRGRSAVLILDNGLNLEAWAQRYYSNFPNLPRVTLSQGITPIPIRSGEYAGKPNPHAWMSPRNALIYVDNIRQALSQIDPDHAQEYQRRADQYQGEIRQLDRRLRESVQKIPADRRFMVTCEGAFSYLARDYGLQEVYLWAVNSEEQGTPQQIARVVDQVKKQNIPAVFCESTVSDRTMTQIAQQTGAKYGGVFYVDSLTAPDGSAPTYLQLLEYNINTLIRGLT